MLGRVALAGALVSLGLIAAAPKTSAGPAGVASDRAAIATDSLVQRVRHHDRRRHRWNRYHHRHYRPYSTYYYTPSYAYEYDSYEYDPGYGYGYGEGWSDAQYGYYGNLDRRESCEFWRKICVARWGWGNSNYAQCKWDHGC